MKLNKKIHLRRWLMAIGAAAAIGAGAAYATGRECWNCLPCGCAEDGGYLMCCSTYAC
jgi:hypothetical protein